MVKKTFKIRKLALPVVQSFTIVLGLGFSTLFYYAFYSYNTFDILGLFLFFMASFILSSSCLMVFGFEAVTVNANDNSWVHYTNIFGIKAAPKFIKPDYLNYVLISETAYRDDMTPIQSNPDYYIVYIIYEEVRKQEIIETTDYDLALSKAEELAEYLSLELKTADHVD